MTAHRCLTPPIPRRSVGPFSSPSSTITRAWCPTPSSIGTSRRPAWRTVSNTPSRATAAPWL
jgi:hypothetical protein